MILISAFITQAFSPQAGGSGISEMKVILRGVVLKGNIHQKMNVNLFHFLFLKNILLSKH